VYVLLVIDMGYTTLSVYTYECTREPNRANNVNAIISTDAASSISKQPIRRQVPQNMETLV
jgi:hypothetical protein